MGANVKRLMWKSVMGLYEKVYGAYIREFLGLRQ